jgi:hypothetical protein
VLSAQQSAFSHVEHAGQACDNYYIVVILNHGVLLLRE